VHFAFDPQKDRRNRRDHGVSLARMDDMAADTIVAAPDLREDYGEERWVVFGLIDAALYAAAVTFTPARVFSLRRATRAERTEYAHAVHKTPRP
jgi:uncharacterized DUF497 family protein